MVQVCSPRGACVLPLICLSLVAGACSGGQGAPSSLTLSTLGTLQLLVGDTPAGDVTAPPPLVFETGGLADGATVDKTFAVRNVAANGPLEVRRIALRGLSREGALTLVAASGPHGPVLPADGALGDLSLAPGESLTVTARYHHAADLTGALGAVELWSENVPDEQRRVLLPVSVGDAYPVGLITPSLVELGTVPVGQTKARELRITNTGGAALVVRAVRFEDSDPDFALSFDRVDGEQSWRPAEGEGAFEPPLTLAPGASAALQVRYAPSAAHPAEGTLVFQTNEAVGEQRVHLTANTATPCLEVRPTTVQFGAKLVGTQASLPVKVSSCGGRPLQIRQLSLAPDSSGSFSLDLAQLPGGVAPSEAAPLWLPIGDSVTLTVRYTPAVSSPLDADGVVVMDLATLVIDSNAPEGALEVPISGLGTTAVCPTAVGQVLEGEEVVPQTLLHLSSEGSFGLASPVTQYEWRVEQPPGSASVFLPTPAFPNPVFEVNAAGAYVFRLDVRDADGVRSCVPWEQTVLVVPDEAIHVELLWRTPGDPDETDTGAEVGSDLDLHFAHAQYAVGTGYDGDGDGVDDPWFAAPYDCFWFNAQPNWGTFAPAADDDPGLDRDDTDGAGPENLNLSVPQNGATYAVGVHYWSDHCYGDAYATVRIYLHSTLVFERADVRLSAGDLWDVARVSWPQGAVSPQTRPDGGDAILPHYQNPNFGGGDACGAPLGG